jgi:hypothetical protein
MGFKIIMQIFFFASAIFSTLMFIFRDEEWQHRTLSLIGTIIFMLMVIALQLYWK